jgi:hypothetical protein
MQLYVVLQCVARYLGVCCNKVHTYLSAFQALPLPSKNGSRKTIIQYTLIARKHPPAAHLLINEQHLLLTFTC